MFSAIVVWERSTGMSPMELERRWKVRNLEGTVERLRDELLWLLSGVGQLLETRSFFYHLKQEGTSRLTANGCDESSSCSMRWFIADLLAAKFTQVLFSITICSTAYDEPLNPIDPQILSHSTVRNVLKMLASLA